MSDETHLLRSIATLGGVRGVVGDDLYARGLIALERIDVLLLERDHYKAGLERIGDDNDPLTGYRGAGDFARAIVRDFL